MLENVPYKSLRHHEHTVEGYSRAAVQTCWRIPELNLGFDLGALPHDWLETSNWCISHCHLDHLAALPQYVACRERAGLPPPRVFLPAEMAAPVGALLRSWRPLARAGMSCELVGVTPGDRLAVSPGVSVSVLATTHTVPSVGFLVWRDEPGGKVDPPTAPGGDDARPLVCYLGDTSPAGLDSTPSVYAARILITELTFVDPRHRRARIHKFGHLHLDDLIERSDRFDNELIVAGHFTARSTERQIRRQVERCAPIRLRERLHLWL